MPLEEYKQKIKDGEDPGIETPEEMPIEIQLLQGEIFSFEGFHFYNVDSIVDFRCIRYKKQAYRVFLYGAKLR